MPKKQIPAETVVDLRRRLNQLPPRSKERRLLVQEIAHLYGISEDTVYRALREDMQVNEVGNRKSEVGSEDFLFPNRGVKIPIPYGLRVLRWG
jgi:hypothetical protein